MGGGKRWLSRARARTRRLGRAGDGRVKGWQTEGGRTKGAPALWPLPPAPCPDAHGGKPAQRPGHSLKLRPPEEWTGEPACATRPLSDVTQKPSHGEVPGAHPGAHPGWARACSMKSPGKHEPR